VYWHDFEKGELSMLRNLIVLALFVQSSSLLASTVTFADLPEGHGVLSGPGALGNIYSENGITITGGGRHNNPEVLHMDDSGTSFSSTASITTDGVFNAVSFDILPAKNDFTVRLFNPADETEITLDQYPYNNVRVQGFRDGTLIAEDNFFMEDYSTYSFNSMFSGLDTLNIMALRPEQFIDGIKTSVLEDYPGYLIDAGCFDAPCAHFDIDNITIAASTITAVPIPAAFPLLLSALSFLTAMNRKKKSVG
jgi:hypothetical protein